MQILGFFTPVNTAPSKLPHHEILSRAARGLTPCPGPRATASNADRARPTPPMNTVAQVELDSLLAAPGGAIVAGLAVTLAYALGLRGLIAGLVIVAGR